MTITPRPDALIDECIVKRITDATATYMVALERIVGSLRTLTTASHGFDYAVSVTPDEMLRILPLISDLEFDIETNFGVTIRTIPYPVVRPDAG
jgi:hypothetical protein